MNGLWSWQTTAGLNAEVGYGFAAFRAGLLTPYAGTVLTDGADRTYRLGTRLHLNGGWGRGLTLNLEGPRQEPAGATAPTQGVQLQATWRF